MGEVGTGIAVGGLGLEMVLAVHNRSQETLLTLNFLKVIRYSSLKLLFLDFKLSLILI